MDLVTSCRLRSVDGLLDRLPNSYDGEFSDRSVTAPETLYFISRTQSVFEPRIQMDVKLLDLTLGRAG